VNFGFGDGSPRREELFDAYIQMTAGKKNLRRVTAGELRHGMRATYGDWWDMRIALVFFSVVFCIYFNEQYGLDCVSNVHEFE